MARAKKAAHTPDPNKLVRQQAGTYRSADDRFEVREGGVGWFVTDGQQTNEFGQPLVLGPFATLAGVRDALPEARRTTLRPVEMPEPTTKPAKRKESRAAESRAAKPRPAKPRPAKAPDHRLVQLLRSAARDRFPPADLAVEILPSPPGRSDAVVSFSGHNVIAAGVDADEARAHLPDDDPAGPMSAPFLTWLGLQLGTPPGSLDVVMVADGTGSAGGGALALEPRDDADAHARVERALRYRSEVSVHADPERRGVVILGRGLAERREVSIEVDPARRGRGLGAALARAALALVPANEPLYAQVAPGNVASVRAFLRAGFRPICSEVLFLRR